MAGRHRFELWELLHSAVFKAAALSHSATYPDLNSDTENLFTGFLAYGGGPGIRTLGTLLTFVGVG